jgi:ABC-2 type transport system permease protein
VTRRSDLTLAWLWLQGRLRLTRRSPRATFFTLVFPLILLVLLNSLNSSTVPVPGGHVSFAQYFTPSIAVFALTAATYSFVIFGVATAHEQGIFKRIRGTPLPMWIFVGTWVAANVLAAVGSVVVMFVVGVSAFGVTIRPGLLPAAAVTLILGGVTFSALGFAVASFVRRADTAPIVANLTLFPLLFVSGVFYPSTSQPEWLQRIANLFPLSHLVNAFEACFSPFTTGSGFEARDLFSLLVWAVIGTVVAVRRLAREATDEQSGAVRPRLSRRTSTEHARS